MQVSPEPVYIVKAMTYQFPSMTTPGVVYQVTCNQFTGRATSCTCPSAVKGYRECKHQKEVNGGRPPCKPTVKLGIRPDRAARQRELMDSMYGGA